jgi:hypothetical protein
MGSRCPLHEDILQRERLTRQFLASSGLKLREEL